MNEQYNLDELEDEILDEIKRFEEKEQGLLQQQEEKDGGKKIVRSGENIFNNEYGNVDIITNEIKHLLKQRKQQQQQQQLLQDGGAIKDSNKKLDNNDIFSNKFVNEYENILRSTNNDLQQQQQQQQQQLSRSLIDFKSNKDIGKMNSIADGEIQLLEEQLTEKRRNINEMNQITNNGAGIFPINNVDELIDIVDRIVTADVRSNGLLGHSAKK